MVTRDGTEHSLSRWPVGGLASRLLPPAIVGAVQVGATLGAAHGQNSRRPVDALGITLLLLGPLALAFMWRYPAAVLFTGFLVFDLNRVASTKGATEGQAILLAVSVYLDIINLFLALLRLFGFAAGGGSSRND